MTNYTIYSVIYSKGFFINLNLKTNIFQSYTQNQFQNQKLPWDSFGAELFVSSVQLTSGNKELLTCGWLG